MNVWSVKGDESEAANKIKTTCSIGRSKSHREWLVKELSEAQGQLTASQDTTIRDRKKAWGACISLHCTRRRFKGISTHDADTTERTTGEVRPVAVLRRKPISRQQPFRIVVRWQLNR